MHRMRANFASFEAWLDVRHEIAASSETMALTSRSIYRTAVAALAISIFGVVISGTALAAVAMYSQARAVRARMASELAARSRFLRGLMHEVRSKLPAVPAGQHQL